MVVRSLAVACSGVLLAGASVFAGSAYAESGGVRQALVVQQGVDSVRAAHPAAQRPDAARQARRPYYVAGYTNHAKLRMSERGYSTTTVENCIKYGPAGIDQGDGTWKVTDDYPVTVVINTNAYVVTVY